MDDYDLLIYEGNIGFYKSCEVTEIFLENIKKEKLEFFTLAVFEEKSFEENEVKCLAKDIPIKEGYTLNIHQYLLSLDHIKENFDKLKNDNIWISNDENKFTQDFSKLKYIPKQFIPSLNSDNRLSKVLKNNFFNGSYILEFFNENKSSFDFILKEDNTIEMIYTEIKKYIPINLYSVRDRIGNFIFQFPITLLEMRINSTNNRESVNFNFLWHPEINNYPDCLLEVESFLDGNCMGMTIEKYNKKDCQVVNVGNVNFECFIKVWKSEPKLLLYYYNGGFIRKINFKSSITGSKLRYFKVEYYNNEKYIEQVPISDKDFNINSKKEYGDFINYAKGLVDKEELKKNLSFKEYFPSNDNPKEAIFDLQKLIKEYGENGIYLWDRYLTPIEVIQTLYYSCIGCAPLKAICNTKLKNIDEWKKTFEDLDTNNYKLNLEFRFEHGSKSFHDRFIIFPGKIETFEKPHVFSLGTSINSFSENKYHILQEVLHPDAVLNSFNKLWDELEEEEDYLIWKHP